ncbi:MAG: hypothetical protein OXL34_14450 [Gemmatimonadota bacterium]|nr:hypothetical protein [Gemmatimonadota bacterium]
MLIRSRFPRGFSCGLIPIPLLLLALGPPGTASAQSPDTLPSDPPQDAYLDETARRLILGAKAARDTSRLAIDAYTAVIRERVAMEAPSFRRDRPWVSGERAVRVRWSRTEPNIVHVLGTRFRRPGLGAGDTEFFPGLRAERFAADPVGDPFNFGIAMFAGPRNAAVTMRSPLEPESERHYQFRSGDTLTLQLEDGEVVRAVAVTAIPRYRSIRLVSAIIWIDPESHAIARVAYRLAKKVDREMSWRVRLGSRSLGFGVNVQDSALESSSEEGLPRFLDRLLGGVINETMPRMEMDITAVVADYGLWDMRHWLPRSVKWTGYVGINEGVNATDFVPPSSPVTIDWAVEIEEISERGTIAVAGTPASAAEALRLWSHEGDSIGGEVESGDPAETVTITPADRVALTASDLLPPSFWDEDRAFDEATLAGIASELEAIGTGEGGDAEEAASPWFFQPPGKTLRLLRYNPVERLSVGTRLHRDFSWGAAVLTAKVATGGLDIPDVDLTLRRDHPRRRILVSFYRSLRSGDVGGGGDGSPGLYVTGDPADFHWSQGAAVRILPSAGDRNWLSLRLFAQQDIDVVGDGKRDRIGAALGWRPWWGGVDPGSVGGGGGAGVRVSAGDNPHVRALVEGALVVPLPRRMSLGVQAGAARVWGDPAGHDLWRIGETGDWLRGHEDAVRASRIAMARVDVQRPLRFLRLSVFGDWARADGDDFYAVGAGLVFMEGTLRLDVARGLRRGRVGGPEAVLRVHLLGDAFF